MLVPLPKWLMKRYAILWCKFNESEFDHEQACGAFEKDGELVSLFLSEMKKRGWLEVKINPHDTRKRVYKLISPNEAVLNMIKVGDCSVVGKTIEQR